MDSFDKYGTEAINERQAKFKATCDAGESTDARRSHIFEKPRVVLRPQYTSWCLDDVRCFESVPISPDGVVAEDGAVVKATISRAWRKVHRKAVPENLEVVVEKEKTVVLDDRVRLALFYSATLETGIRSKEAFASRAARDFVYGDDETKRVVLSVVLRWKFDITLDHLPLPNEDEFFVVRHLDRLLASGVGTTGESVRDALRERPEILAALVLVKGEYAAETGENDERLPKTNDPLHLRALAYALKEHVPSEWFATHLRLRTSPPRFRDDERHESKKITYVAERSSPDDVAAARAALMLGAFQAMEGTSDVQPSLVDLTSVRDEREVYLLKETDENRRWFMSLY